MNTLEPVLTIETLRNLLEKLSRAESLENNPLAGFALVWRQYNHPDVPRGNLTLQYVVYDLLERTVFDELHELRRLHERPEPNYELTYNEAVTDIQADIACNNEILSGGCLAFYQYLRPELGISTEVIAGIVHTSARSLRRYRNRFLAHLQHRLIRDELTRRMQERTETLLLKLPRHKLAPLSTQQTIIDICANLLSNYDHAQPLLLFGPQSIGKSVCALQIAQQLLESGHFFDALWLDLSSAALPASTTTKRMLLTALVADHLRLASVENQTPLHALQQYLSLQGPTQRLLLVLDNADDYLQQIHDNWQWLAHFTCIVTARTRPATWQGIEQKCPTLTLPDTTRLLQFLQHRLVPNHSMDDLAVYSEHFWVEFGGNAGRIRYSFQRQLEIPPLKSANITGSSASDLSQEAQLLYLLVQTIEQQQLATYALLHQFSESLFGIEEQQLHQLIVNLCDHQLLHVEHEPTDHIYRSHNTRYQCTTMAYEAFVNAIVVAENERFAFTCLQLEHLVPFTLRKLSDLLKLAHEYILQTGYWQAWLSLLEVILDTNSLTSTDWALLQLEVAIAQRWRGNFQDAEAHLQLALQQADVENLANLKARALLEKAVLLNYQNKPATDFAQQALSILIETGNPEQIDTARTILARTLQREDNHAASNILRQVRHRDSTYWSLVAQVNIQNEEFSAAHEAASACVALLHPEDTRYARALALLAQTHLLLNQPESTRHIYETALNYAQQSYDVIALSRLYYNFSYFLFKNAQPREARKYALRAVFLQEQLQDDVGLHSAMHVLQLIEQALEHQ